MWDLFKAQVLRFRGGAIALAVLHLVVLGFMTRVVDLAQQPRQVYQVVGGVYVLAGLLLGAYQMGGYRRANAWLHLLHRPLAPWRIGASLTGAGALMLGAAIVLPLAVIALWQEAMTPRVLDQRHLMLVASGWLVALCGYLAGAYALLAPRRHAYAALTLLLLVGLARANGAGAIALQLLVLAWLVAMLATAFKPDLDAAPRGPGLVVAALPMQLAMWLALMLVGVVVETVWIMQGSHPNNMAVPTPGSIKESDNAEGAHLLRLGLASATDPRAPLWREQTAISEVHTMGPNLGELPVRHELTNLTPMEFDDTTRRVRWIFSHDAMRFVGYRLADQQPAGELGVAGAGRFDSPPLPGPEGALLTRTGVFQYDAETGRILQRVRLPAGEILAGADLLGQRAAVLSDHALYFYDLRELELRDGPLTVRQRVPLPGRTGNLTRIDVMELLDGYLVSFFYGRSHYNAEGDLPYQQIVQVSEEGRTTPVARRNLPLAYPSLWRYQNWYVSPILHTARREALALFAPHQTLYDDVSRAPVPRGMVGLAIALAALCLVLGAWRLRRVGLSVPARAGWLLACVAVGLPALMALWLLHPPREQLELQADTPQPDALPQPA